MAQVISSKGKKIYLRCKKWVENVWKKHSARYLESKNILKIQEFSGDLWNTTIFQVFQYFFQICYLRWIESGPAIWNHRCISINILFIFISNKSVFAYFVIRRPQETFKWPPTYPKLFELQSWNFITKLLSISDYHNSFGRELLENVSC